MRIFAIVISLCFLQACSLISREAGYPGGNFGFLADRHALFARGQEQQVNRYLVTLALVAPLMAETAKTSSEARLSAERVKVLYENIDQLQKASKRCPLPKLASSPKPSVHTIQTSFEKDCTEASAGNPEGSALSFESLSFEVTKSLNDALKQAFDNLELRSNASRVIALEPTEMLRTILKARHLVPVLLKYLSSYRDVTIIFGLSVVDSCAKAEAARTAVYDLSAAAAVTAENAVTLESASQAGIEDVANDVTPADKDRLAGLKRASKAAADQAAADKKAIKSASCAGMADSFNDLLNRKRTADTDLARDERPIRDVFLAGEKALNDGLDWQLSKTHKVALLHHVNRACKKLDALAKIEPSLSFVGCSVDLTKLSGGAVGTAGTEGSKQQTSKAVMGIIDG